ncbi:MAG: NAD(P)H-quinone oxidoreductase [Planctomycetes bacterium]|nr:NAD(P)H-quinone oxidoreductase [Planctomycetota bacterium]
MHAIVCEGAGGPEVLSWVDDAPAPPARAGWLRIAVRWTAVNRADLLQRQGYYPPPPGASPLLGLEAAGVVLEAAGPFAVGDEVMALLPGGGYASEVVVDPRHVLPVPGAIGLQSAGGLMETFLTAYLNLTLLGELEAGQRVLVHGESGGVGTAALQWANRLGAEVWTTASGAKLERCRALGATRALDYRLEDFATELELAGGADLILDCLGARYLEPNLRALRTHGRLIVIGLQGGRKAELDLLTLLQGRKQILGSTLRTLADERKADLVSRFRDEVWPLLDRGELAVVVERSFPLRCAAAAHAHLASGAGVGKILLEV